MIRIAICDDDLTFLDYFAQLLTASFADVGQRIALTKFSSGIDLLEKVELEHQIFDVIFLDVEMPSINGFQLAHRLREQNSTFMLIFTTYIENQARKGYLYGAFRYVFKNHLETEVREAVASLLNKFSDIASDHEDISFKCRIAGVIETITVKKGDILFLKTEKTKYVALRTIYLEYELLLKPLAEYANQLNASVFVPIMRNYLLNLNHVERIERDSFILTGGFMVPLGIKRQVRKASIEKYLQFLEERI